MLQYVDENSLRYCICNSEPFGEMVECDDQFCEVEWFHTTCVKVKTSKHDETSREWYCPSCTKRREWRQV